MDRTLMPKFLLVTLVALPLLSAFAMAQQTADKPQPAAEQEGGRQYSGMYTFLKEGEFVQITVEDDNRITGFISRYGSGQSDQGAFLDQFFKTGKLEGNKLTFSTDIVHGISFEFKGTIERGEGKAPGDEAYFVLKGTLTDKTSDVNKKVTAHSSPVAFKKFPEDAAPPQTDRQ